MGLVNDSSGPTTVAEVGQCLPIFDTDPRGGFRGPHRLKVAVERSEWHLIEKWGLQRSANGRPAALPVQNLGAFAATWTTTFDSWSTRIGLDECFACSQQLTNNDQTPIVMQVCAIGAD